MAKTVVYSALFAVLTWLGYFIQLPLGPVPISAQTLIVLCAAFILSPKEAFFAMFIHALLRILLGGGEVFLLPSFGFIISFIIVCPLMALMVENDRKKMRLKNILPAQGLKKISFKRLGLLLGGSLAFYLIGFPYMVWILKGIGGSDLPLAKLFKIGFLIFIPGDILKIILAYFMIPRINKALGNMNNHED